MDTGQIAIAVTVAIVIAMAIFLTFRDRYTDLTRHAESKPAEIIELNLPRIESGQVKGPDDYWKARVDGHEEFAANFGRFFGSTADFSFHTKIVGINHANRDRTRRGPAIKKCVPLEILVLEPEPDNEEDPFAIAVKRSDNRFHLGYLDWITARDIRRDTENGRFWIALFKRFWCAESGAVIGAEILLVRLKSDAIQVIDPKGNDPGP